ncbi:MAG: nicotinate-nicotinamide nucleotide adenylyltransferase [Deltaproteobacteria bacterium CG_4_8_14_3_um_filter_43_13]|nr:MAG: nicotinate-nicotinamide nucleotide adenylyltransferase [Deltaproteobacteria bacterium CG_4_8_14_3_um_filter_43_13]
MYGIKMEDYLRVGLFGGTFNPIHLGHLRSAEEVREFFNLQRVIFIPSANPPHKQGKDIISPIHRMEMVNLAIEGNQGFSVSDIEIKRRGKSYSIETIDHIRKIHGSDLTLFFIMGIDAFTEISTWKDHINLFSCCNFVVTTRPGYSLINLGTVLPADVAEDFSYLPEEDRFIHASNFSLCFRDITHLDISSSVVRKKIKENRSTRYLLPEKVIEYIKQHGLYKDS